MTPFIPISLAAVFALAWAGITRLRRRRHDRCECGGLGHRLVVREPLPVATAIPTAWRRR